MQNLRENSFEIKQNLNWSESARINLPTVMAEWLFNFELPSLKESKNVQIQALQTVFISLFSLAFCAFFIFDTNDTDVKLFTMT